MGRGKGDQSPALFPPSGKLMSFRPRQGMALKGAPFTPVMSGRYSSYPGELTATTDKWLRPFCAASSLALLPKTLA
jgi:hypothetical protein